MGEPGRLARLVRMFENLVEAGYVLGSHVEGAAVLLDAAAPASLEGAKRFLAMTPRGRELLAALPASTKFKSYDRDPNNPTWAYYDKATNTIYMPRGLNNLDAAILVAHEMLHADQLVNHERGRYPEDLLLMEIQAKDAMLDVYEQLRGDVLDKVVTRAPAAAEWKKLAALRASSREDYETEIRITYRDRYDVH